MLKTKRGTDVWNFDKSPDKRNLYISWLISLWCNFNCSYCFYTDHSRKQVLEYYKPSFKRPASLVKYALTRNKFAHSFDNYPAELWVDKILKISEGRKIALKITGGEPFLDRDNFYYVLSRLVECENIDNIRVDTNGSFAVDKYHGLNFDKVFLNLSFHPESISIENLLDRTKGFIDSGLNVAMINYVMAPSQRADFDKVREIFSKIGVAVNPGVYIDCKKPKKSLQELMIYSKYLKEFDIKNKTGLMNLKNNKLCRFPQIGLSLAPDSLIMNSCFSDKKINFIKSSSDDVNSLLLENIAKCPKSFCSETNKYSFQSECKRNLNSLNPLKSYIDDALIL